MTYNISLQPTAIPLRGLSAAELKRWDVAHTAATIAQPSGMTAEPVSGLIDLDHGAWYGLSDAEVHAR